MTTNKMRFTTVALALCLLLSACSPATKPSEPAAGSQSPAPSQPESQSQPESSQPAAGSDPVEVVMDGLKLSCPQLGFSVELPALLEGHLDTAVTTTDVYDEVMTTVTVSYQSAVSTSVLLFDEMSTAAWEKMKAAGGPQGTELGTSAAGRVVVMNTLQSNPFAEETEDYKVFQEWPGQLGVVKETFAFDK